MASFTDNVPQFNPYVQQLPVEAMVKVGMEKQQNYNKGIERIQSSIDNIAGLDIERDVDKAYLQSKVNELGTNLKKFMGSDFSDFQLQNTVGGMANGVSKDKNVRTAVSSTALYRKEVGVMETARSKGELTPENEYDFGLKVSPWINGTDPSQGFSGKYVPYFDVDKFTRETFDKIKPDSYSFDQIFETDSKGNVLKDNAGTPKLSTTMKRLEKEGIFPPKVKEVIDQVFSEPKVSQQLGITGQYVYRGLDSEALQSQIGTQKKEELANYETQLFDLNLKQSMGGDAITEIDALRSQITKVSSAYNDYQETAANNPNYVRGNLYKDAVRSRYTKMFSWTKSSEQQLVNPAYQVELELNKMEQARSQWQWDANFKVNRANVSDMQSDRQYDLDVFKAKNAGSGQGGKGKGKKGEQYDENGNLIIPDEGFEVTSNTDENNQKVSMYADDQYTTAANSYSTSRDQLIWQTVFQNNRDNEALVEKIRNADGNKQMSREKAISAVIKNTARSQNKSIEAFREEYMGKIKGDKDKYLSKTNFLVTDLFESTVSKEKEYKQELLFKKKRDKLQTDALTQIGVNPEIAKLSDQTVKFNGKNLVVTKQDYLDMAAYYKGSNAAYGALNDEQSSDTGKEAKLRLDQRGLGLLAETLYTNLNSTPNTLSAYRALTRRISDDIGNDEWNSNKDVFKLLPIVKQLISVVNTPEYRNIAQEKADLIKNNYNIQPSRGYTLPASDRAKLSAFSAAFTPGGKSQNLASADDFESFQDSFKDKDALYSIYTDTDSVGKPIWTVSYESEGRVKGKMVLNKDQAKSLGYETEAIFEDRKTTAFKNQLNFYGNKTSLQPASAISTYTGTSRDYYFDKDAGDFKGVTNPNVIVRGNVDFSNGKYYPYIFVSDGTTKKMYGFKGVESAERVTEAMTNLVNDQLVNKILNSK
jgi:hypothetical protein